MRRILCCTIVMLAVLAGRAESQHHSKPHSVLDAFLDADIVAICRVENAVKPNNALKAGQVDLVMEDVLRSHAILKGKKSVVIPRYIEPTKPKLLVAMDQYKGKIDPYGGVFLDQNGQMEKFVRGALLLKDKSQAARAKYAVDFLENSSPEVAASVYVELSRTKYADLRKFAGTLKPDLFRKAIQNEKTPEEKVGMYALLLAHCGSKEDAKFIRKRIDEKRGQWIDLFKAYVLLEKEAGWRLVAERISQKESSFFDRYAALQTARFFYEERKDIIPEKKSLAAITSMLQMPDMADFAVEDLRKWQRWEYSDEILKLPAKLGFKNAVLKKAVLRFALQCPTQQAKDYVNAERARDPKFVEDTKEILDLEWEALFPKKQK